MVALPAAASPVAAPAPPALPSAPPAPATPATPSISALDVHGSLPVADVRRAIDRLGPALARCSADRAETVVVQLAIGEARKAEHVRTSGGTTAASDCVAAAFAGLRTEAAPDVGDAEVTVHVAFVLK